ncbi:MAG: tRNA threonylcarbamoyl adenosine modification protein (Sua5/YciO/YrdC/YwlC family) [Parasphingorhabdus sp.]|jgi:tRNA threonylcarbamoyl adenosine modification protein (Sua5/YciO/YrdC/YwlC family)
MAQYFEVHPSHPQLRLVRRAVEIIQQGGVIAYPTDSSYALGCSIGNKNAVEQIRRIRHLDDQHNFTLVCQALSDIAVYAKFDNTTFRLIKACTPGPYTFILSASKEVPRRLQHPKRKTIGIRVPDFPIVKMLLEELGEPIMSSTLILPGSDLPENDALEIRDKLEKELDVVIDGGPCEVEPTTVVDLSGDEVQILRHGRGDVSQFE